VQNNLPAQAWRSCTARRRNLGICLLFGRSCSCLFLFFFLLRCLFTMSFTVKYLFLLLDWNVP
jgi:hypothetical protein